MKRDSAFTIISTMLFIIIFITLIIDYFSIYYLFFIIDVAKGGQAIFYFIYYPILAFSFIVSPIQTYYWVFVLTIIITAVLILITRDFIIFIKDKNYDRPLSLADGITIVISLTLISYLISIIMTRNSNPFGNPTSGIPNNDLIVELLQAPVWEEFVYRSIIIGIPLYLYNISIGNNVKLHRMITGGNYDLNLPSIILIIFSSILFGYAHTASWSIYKVPSAIIAGIVLGILYVRYGIYMSIAMHFFIDFSGSLDFYPKPLNFIFNLYISIVYFIMVAVGIVLIIFYIMNTFEKPRKDKIKNKGVDEINKNKFTVICPYCGYDKHEILPDGNFKCLRCGNTFKIEFSSKPPESIEKSGGEKD